MLPHLPLPLPAWPALLVAALLGGGLWWWSRRVWLALVGGSLIAAGLGVAFGWQGVWQLPSYAVALGCGIVGVYPWLCRRAARRGIDERALLLVLAAALLAGAVGARLWYAIEFRQRVLAAGQDFVFWNFLDGGMVLYGGLIAGSLAGLLVATWRRCDRLALADALAPPVLIGIAAGRLGCWLNGCCYGGACELPWATPLSARQLTLTPAGDWQWQDVPHFASQQHELVATALASGWVHPVQLYAVLVCCLLALVLVVVERRQGSPPRGLSVALALAGYGSWRALAEVLRSDNPALLGSGLSASQLTSLLIALAAAAWVYRIQQRHRRAARAAAVVATSAPNTEG